MEEKKLSEACPRVKIVFLCRDYGKVDRGVESHVEELSKRLKEKFDVHIFSGKDADDINKIIKGNFNLVIPTNGRVQAAKVSVGRIVGKYKVLIAGHAGIGRDEIINLLTFPDVYVALTDFELNWAKKYAFGVELKVIPNGIDLEKFKSIGRKQNVGLSGQIILSVGALEWYKYHDLAIKAVSKLPEASLLIVGKGKDNAKLKNLGNQLLGEKRFKIMDVDYHQMPEIYRSADLFTLPSWNREAFGIVYLEAMATGLAVVAPDDLTRSEIVGDGGILVDVFDTEKYAEALKNGLTKKWGDVPRHQAEKFSWDKICKKYEELILQICR